MLRLFIAIDLPLPVREALGRLHAGDLEGVKWVDPARMHLTLRFLGDVDDDTTNRLIEQLDEIRLPTFEMRLRGVGVFPGLRVPRVLWAGVEAEGELLSLHEAVERAVMAAGLPPDGRPFHPHVTLARIKRGDPRTIRHFLQRHRDFDGGRMTVNRYALYASTLLPDGARHDRLADFPLTA